jgi:hypothetical protein
MIAAASSGVMTGVRGSPLPALRAGTDPDRKEALVLLSRVPASPLAVGAETVGGEGDVGHRVVSLSLVLSVG